MASIINNNVVDIGIHEGVNLDDIIRTQEEFLIRTPSMHYTNNYKTFLDENPELTPFVVESQFWEGERVYLNILYRYKGEIWNRVYKDGSIILQNKY